MRKWCGTDTLVCAGDARADWEDQPRRQLQFAPMTAIFIAIAVAIFLIANVATFRVLVRVHPRRRWIVIALVVVGNVMWVFFPILNARTDFSRFVRAFFGPPWFAWTCFAILYATFALLLAIAWLPF